MVGNDQWGQYFALHEPQLSSLLQLFGYGKGLGRSTTTVSVGGGESQRHQFGIVDHWVSVGVVNLDPVTAFAFTHGNFGNARYAIGRRG